MVIAIGVNSKANLVNLTEWHIFDGFVKNRFLHEEKNKHLPYSEEQIKEYLGKMAIQQDRLGNITFKNYFSETDDLNVSGGIKKFYDYCCQMNFLKKTYSGNYSFSHLKLRDYFAIAPLIEIITSEKQRGKGFAAYAFEYIGPIAINALVSLLDNESSEVKEKALWALRLVGDDSVIPKIIELLFDDDTYVRWYAIETLSVIGDESVVQYLINKYDDYEPDPFIREAIVMALGELGSNDALIVLEDALYDEMYFVNITAADALEKIGSEDAIRILEKWTLKGDD